MNTISLILKYIVGKLGNVTLPTTLNTVTGAISETYGRTRGCYGAGTYTVSRLYGIHGYMGSGNVLTLCIPLNVGSAANSISFTSLVASIRIVAGGYVYSTSGDLTSDITSATIITNQPLVVVRITNSNFAATANTPVSGEITSATFTITES